MKVPPNIHVFLWLAFYNKCLTRDNFAKKRHIVDATCVFCFDSKSIQHLFFDCVATHETWLIIVDVCVIHVPSGFTDLTVSWKKGSLVRQLIW